MDDDHDDPDGIEGTYTPHAGIDNGIRQDSGGGFSIMLTISFVFPRVLLDGGGARSGEEFVTLV